MEMLSILLSRGSYTDMNLLVTVLSGAVAYDKKVHIFVANDAVWAFRKDRIGTDTAIHSHDPVFAEKFAKGLEGGQLIKPWWEQLRDLKEAGDVSIVLCSAMTLIDDLTLEDFDPMVDKIKGAASYLADLEDCDKAITI